MDITGFVIRTVIEEVQDANQTAMNAEINSKQRPPAQSTPPPTQLLKQSTYMNSPEDF